MVRAAVATLVQQLGYGLRQERLACRRITISLHYSDGVMVNRQATSKIPLDDETALTHLANTALYLAWRRRIRLRQSGAILKEMNGKQYAVRAQKPAGKDAGGLCLAIQHLTGDFY